MAGKARVHELAKELGVTSKEVLARLSEQGEFVKSASSTVEAPVARRLKLGGDTGFNVRYSGWIDPYRADSSIAMGRNAAWWTSTSAPPDDSSATVWHRDVAADRNSIWRSPVNVTYWLSVRCVARP